MSTPPGLGPHCVGQRVVVRRVLPGEQGPTGGPAFTDVLGVMESWAEGSTTVRDAAGKPTTIAIRDIVSGKPVPPRASVRHRVTAEEAERRAVAAWRPVHTAPLGDWLLRAAGGYSSRANSVLAVGDPGTGFGPAVKAVLEYYAEHRLPPVAQVVVGSEVHHAFEVAGWVTARPGEADTAFQLASVAQAVRAVRRTAPADPPAVEVDPRAGADWLADDERSRSFGEDALAVLEGSAEGGFAAVRAGALGAAEGEAVVAKGRVAGSFHGTDPWAGISNVWVASSYRRRGLAVVVMGALLGWAAERGATTAYLQTRGDNPGALALYERLGFVTHHTYRYLRPPH